MLEMFEYGFMQRAFLAGVIIAVLASISGTFIVLRRYSMISETLAHSALVGVAIGLVAEYSPLWSAIVFAIISAWLIEYLRSSFSLYSDAVLSILLSGSLAIAVIIVSLGGAFNNSLFSYLFGSILSVSSEDVITIAIFGAISLGALLFFSKELYFVAYDEEVAKTSGIKVDFLNFLLVTVVAIIIALSIRVVGSLLIGALMVIPSVSALQFRVGLLKTVLISLVFALLSVICGMTLSFYFSLPSGATIVLCVLGIFIVSLVINRK
ncbi:MAG: zinc ABC transporter permease [Sulfurimonas sp. RIFOXYD12_FULL_33_39]|uniref:metal ABC transporter permease n=1 Tax=unclassified Sulfurimonas TaxID=2623549 RepID=UPI0008D27BE2|nr:MULTISPECIES: metal ABC transporter permease [unclassified Sulfurimonas]OHE06602.1 MAG: zinc ABC transporter permease [Sulfurimonas sp. RIFCSPLOWO2_12_FULL_34_6]OHE10980.1 MAG: zinc ABC transporter permease [Sulfurimonas sp. RIFOXYD12_FULL_33_39]OHE13251.1 MAG: zinc ABC transporter permease [Sulfurimonas sp. RIFOXYD2_FULL_34_21]